MNYHYLSLLWILENAQVLIGSEYCKEAGVYCKQTEYCCNDGCCSPNIMKWYLWAIVPCSFFLCCVIGCVIKRKKRLKRVVHNESLFYVTENPTVGTSEPATPMTDNATDMIDPRLISYPRDRPQFLINRLPPPYTEINVTINHHTGQTVSAADRCDAPPSYSSIFR